MRKTKSITLKDDGQELNFFIKQMSALETERWGVRLLKVLAKGDLDVPDLNDISSFSGLLLGDGLGKMIRAFGEADLGELYELLDDLLACCHHVSGPNSMTRLTPELTDSIISNVKTLFRLRQEAFMLNLGFIFPEGTEEGAPLSGPQALLDLRRNARPNA